MQQFFIAIYRFIERKKRLAIAIAVALLCFFGFFAAQIQFEEDITRIIPKSEKSDVTAKVLQQINFSDKITVIIEKDKNGSENDLIETATTFLEKTASLNQYIEEIQGKVDDYKIQQTIEFVYDNLPLFLDDSDYALIDQKLNNDSIAAQVEKNYKTLISPTGIVAKDFILNDPLGISFLGLKKLQELNSGDDFQLKDGFLITKDNSKLLLFISPKLAGTETEKSQLFVEKLKEIQQQLNDEFKGKTDLTYFGSSFIAVANAKQIKADIMTTVIISLSLLVLVLVFFYRNILVPIIIFIPTVFGVVIAMAFLYFIKDSISAISLSVGAVLLGVTIDYSLHILTHYKHNNNIETLYKDIVKPLLMSSGTTAIAFLCLLFVHSEALKDLGIFAAVCVMVSAISSLLIVPHLYKPKEITEEKPDSVLDKIAFFSFHKNKFLIISCLVIVVVSLFTFKNVTFNNNLSELNYVPDEIKLAESKLEKATNLTSKSIYLTSYGNSIDEALAHSNTIYKDLLKRKENKEILTLSSIGGLVLSEIDQKQKIEKWKTFWTSEKKDLLQKSLIANGESLGFKKETHQQFFTLLNADFSTIQFSDYEAVKALFLKEFVSKKEGFYTISSLVKLNLNERENFVEAISKNENLVVIDRKQMNETFLGQLRDDFTNLINYSLIAVLLILFVFFKRIELVLLSAIPIIITGIVTGGLMNLFGLQLNIFSTIVCTMIFGLGVDFSIFMTSALQKEYSYGKSVLPTYRASILMAAITTILAIGALIFAQHPALKSISAVSLIGIFSALIITFVFYPILFTVCIINRPKRGNSPISLRLLVHSTLSFIYYGTGGLVFSFFGRIILYLLPVNAKTRTSWFRKIISKFMKSVLYSNPFVKKKIVNLHGEKFEKSAIVIANHTSFLDTLATGMVTHKIIYLVNDWVYQSPVFGGVVKLAGYYPVSQGLEDGVDHLRKKVEQGYSLMVFPEGTRSEDNIVKRFHKGAFYLAEQYQLDILPIYIHGNSDSLPKGDHIIYDEYTTVVIGKRIEASDTSFGANYSERTKSINKLFRQEFAKIRSEREDENYFKNKLFLSFLYKEAEIIKAVKADFEKNKRIYFNLNEAISPSAKILHFADDYGQLDVLLTLQQAKRRIQSYIKDEEKRSVARTSYLVKKRDICYVEELTEIGNFDTLLISSKTEESFLTDYISKPKKIILLNNFELKDTILNAGFSILKEETTKLVFIKS
jgi:1-acyl-sn-glycerol-3-phosphate acyltransferase